MPQLRPNIFCLFLIFFFTTITVFFGQGNLTQVVRGTVVDIDSKSPLPGANVILLNSDPLIGTSADQNGNFILENVPVGRQSIMVSFMGYITVSLRDLIVSSGKELILTIELEENVIFAEEVQISAEHRKDQPINPMALASARSFSVEETNRYAGSYGDPSRMVANYAGVVSSRDNRNDIVIRGNSPMGLQYRVDDIEIANPNHFGALGTTGGPITMLNTNLLTNSDFLTGAFPAEFGNVLSGVFDIKMRNGNLNKREFWAQLGWNGLEFGLEGPFSKKASASYLAAYRYSITDIIEKMGIRLTESAKYQDLSFKFNIPTSKCGIFNFFGMGGTSSIKINDSDKNMEDWTFSNHGEDINTASSLAFLGLSHLYFINNSTRLQTHLSFVASQVKTRIDTFSIQALASFLFAGEKSKEMKYAISTAFMKKLNAANNLDIGASCDLYHVNFADSQYCHDIYKYYTNTEKIFYLIQAFSQWQHKFNNNFTSNLGLHYILLTLNGTSSLEPRAGFKWNLNPVQSLNLGIGLHSQIQARMIYFVQSLLPDGNYILTNENLDLSKSLQVVLGYNHLFTEFLRIKAETYYQYLYNIPISEGIPQYSILNEGTEYYVNRQDSLINQGTGINYGLELSFEKFINKNYFFLFTASLFQSKYKGFDKVERSTSFNGNYVFNAVGGYELAFGRRKNRMFIFGLRVTWAGGMPYIPFDQKETVEKGEIAYDWDKAYQQKRDDYFRTSFRFGIRRNEKKFNVELVFDLQYRANYTYVYLYRIDVVTGEIVKDNKMRLYPISTVRIQF